MESKKHQELYAELSDLVESLYSCDSVKSVSFLKS